MPNAVGVTHHISIDTKFFLIRSNTYFKSQQPTANAPTVGKAIDLAPLKKWTQNDWRGGLGQKKFDDAQMYDDGQVDSYSDPHKLGCLPQLSKVTTGTVSVLKDQANIPKFEVRALNDSASAALYIALTGSNDANGEVWKYTSTGGTLSRLTGPVAKHFSAILNFFHDDPHGLIVGTSQESGSPAGHIFKFPGNSDTIGAAALTNKFDGTGGTFSFPRITALANYNDYDYIGTGLSTNGAALYRISSGASWTITKFKDVNCHYISDFAVWNGRLWFLAVLRNSQTRLYVTDGNVVNEAYTWTNAFYGQKLFQHAGSLYVAGKRSSSDETLDIGQCYRYNGSSINLIAEFDESGLTDYPTWSASVKNGVTAMASFGKYLALGMSNRTCLDGNSRRGLWFYDPTQDSWHVGAYKDDADHAHTGAWASADNTITDLREFDGALYIGMTDGAGSIYYLKNAKTAFVKSFYRSSIFDATLPRQDKLWTRIIFEADMAPQGQVVAQYSLDEGTTWTSTTFTNPTDSRVKTEYVWNLGASGVGVIAKTIQLRFDIYPGQAGGSPGAASASSSSFVSSHTVEYGIVNDILWSWQFNVPCASQAQGPDGTVDPRTGEQTLADLRSLQDGLLHTLTDVDGTTYVVKVESVNTYRPDITPDDVDGLHSDAALVIHQYR